MKSWKGYLASAILVGFTATTGTSVRPAVSPASALQQFYTTGWAQWSNGKYTKAYATFENGLRLARKRISVEYEAEFLTGIAESCWKLERYPEDLAAAKQALVLYEGLENVRGTMITLDDLSDVEENLDDYPDALRDAQRELTLARRLNDLTEESSALTNIGLADVDIGNYAEGLKIYQQGLALDRQRQKDEDIATDYGNISDAEEDLGLYGDALRDGRAKLTLARQMKDLSAEAEAYSSIADVEDDIGQYGSALRDEEQALGTAQKSGDVQGEADDLGEIGSIQVDLGQNTAALKSLDKAIQLSQRIEDQDGEASDLLDAGIAYNDLHQYRKALQTYSKALAIFRKIGDVQGGGDTMENIALVDEDLGQYSEAAKVGMQSVHIDEKLGTPQWQDRHAVATAEAKLGRTTEALRDYDASIDSIEQLRAGLKHKSDRSSFFSVALFVYDEYIGYLVDLNRRFPGQGYDRKALQIFERRQSRTFLEEVAQSAARNFAGVPPTIVDNEQNLSDEIGKLRTQIEQAQATRNTNEASLTSLQSAFKTVRQQQQSLESQIASQYPTYYTLLHPHPLDIPDVQHALHPGEAMAVFEVLDSESALWVITPDAFHLYSIDAGWKPVQAQVNAMLASPHAMQEAVNAQLWNAVADRAVNDIPSFAQASWKLYGTLFPAQAQAMLAHSSTLYVVPTGPLAGVPFEALVTRAPVHAAAPHYLIEDRNVAYLSSASLLGLLRSGLEQRRQRAPQPFVAFAPVNFSEISTADPIPTPASVTVAQSNENTSRQLVAMGASASGFPSLPGTEQQVEAVAAVLGASSQSVFLHDNASVNTIDSLNSSGALKNYRYVLFATHAVLPGQVQGVAQPSLVLAHPGQNGFLTMGDVFGLSLDADIVMLSACDSGVGENTSEGVQGLTQAFMYAGTPVVSVTQWEVIDGVERILTPGFFRRLASGDGAAQALRTTKLDFIHGTNVLYQHPFFWAPTVIFGDGSSV